MSGYCKDCGNQLCICDDVRQPYELRKAKQLIRDGVIPNPEDLEWKDFSKISPPKIGDVYLTYPYYIKLEYVHGAFYSKEGKEFVTHWMYLPKAPKENKY